MCAEDRNGALQTIPSAGEAYDRFDKKMREEKPGRPFVSVDFCLKTSDSVCEGVACRSLASHNKIPLTLVHVLKVNAIISKDGLKKKKIIIIKVCKLVYYNQTF